MDAKSLAKSKRAHTQHHKKHHPNQKLKGPINSVGASSTDKTVKEKARQLQGPTALPSNWDRYEDEYDDLISETQSSRPIDGVVPKSKGADYAFLISEAKSQNSTRPTSEIFPSFDDFITDFGQGKGSFFAVRGESILSSIQNDSFIVEDKATASYEASFLSLDLRALSEQLAKVDLPKRLFMEADLFPPELYSERKQERYNPTQDHIGRTGMNPTVHPAPPVAKPSSNQSKFNPETAEAEFDGVIQAHHTSRTVVNPTVQPDAKPSSNQSKFKPETAEAELDMLLDSFSDAKLTDSMGSSNTVAVDIDGTLDDLLNETFGQSDAPLVKSSEPVSKSKLLDDFDSWLDTI